MNSVNVMNTIPAGLHAGILDGSGTTDLMAYFDTAATAAVAQGCPLYVPAGTYTMKHWDPPAKLHVTTDGTATVFKQLDTAVDGSLYGQRFIQVFVDNVRLWPDGAATINGGMTSGGVNATSFNSGIFVYAGEGTTIKSFRVGDVYGKDLGGDTVEIGAHPDGIVGFCRIGTVFGCNIYRNIVSIKAGETGLIDGVIQTGGCGLIGLDFEPNPDYPPLRDWMIGVVKVHRCAIVGDAAAVANSVTILHLDLDYSRPASTPPFNFGGVSATSAPATFETGLRYRNVKSIQVEQGRIVGFPRDAIQDIGERTEGEQIDTPVDVVSFDYLELRDNGATTDHEITVQQTHLFEIGFLRDTEKPSSDTGTFISGTLSTSMIKVNGGQVAGRVVTQISGGITLNDTTITGESDRIFRFAAGPVRLRRVICTSAFAMFDSCTQVPVLEDCTIDATNILLNATTNARYLRSTVNSVYYRDGWANPINALTATGAPHTLELSDDRRFVTMDFTSANTLAVPTNTAVKFPIGATIVVRQKGAGLTTIAAAVGVTLRTPPGKTVNAAGQHSRILLEKIATNEWSVTGDLA